MKKFEVMNAIRNAAQIKGEESYNPENLENLLDDYVEAENEADAIAIAIDWLVEHVTQNSDYRPEATKENIMIYDGEELVEEYYNFIAKEIKE